MSKRLNFLACTCAIIFFSHAAHGQFVINNGIGISNGADVVVNGDWINSAGSVFTNNGTVSTNSSFINDGSVGGSGVNGFIFENSTQVTFRPGTGVVGSLSKSGAGDLLLDKGLTVRDSLRLLQASIILPTTADTLAFLDNAEVSHDPLAHVIGIISHRGSGDKVFPLGRDGYTLSLKLFRTQASLITATVEPIPAGITPGPGVDSLSSLPYVWRVNEKSAADTASYVELSFPSTLAGTGRLIVARESEGNQFTGMGSRAVVASGGTTKVRSYSRRLKGVFGVAHGFANDPITDSLALVALYNFANGSAWTNKTNWLQGNIENWAGVTVAGQTITAISLPNNNLANEVPDLLTDIVGLASINLSGNSLTSIPDFSEHAELNSLNVSSNRLTFASLEPNRTVKGFQYDSQNPFPNNSEILLPVGTDHSLTMDVGGTATTYNYRRNGTVVVTSDNPTLPLPSLNRLNMGDYVIEATNSLLPGLTITSGNQRVLAFTSVSGQFKKDATTAVTDGELVLYQVTTGAYQPVKTTEVNALGEYRFDQVILGDYLLKGFADTIAFEKALPTYYLNTIFWEDADVVAVDQEVTNLDITSQFEPEPSNGSGFISGYLEENVDDGRVQSKRRVSGAGVSARRVSASGRGQEETQLVAYEFTDDNGEFTLPKLPVGEYLINIQYPGIPMNPESDIRLTIDNALRSEVMVTAIVEDGQISVNKINITNIYEQKDYNAYIYPNPSQGEIHIKFGQESAARSIQILDLKGNKIREFDLNSALERLSVYDLAKGMYLFRIMENGMVVKTAKVTIN